MPTALGWAAAWAGPSLPAEVGTGEGEGAMILIVGGGPAGLATAAALRRVGLRAVVLEQAGVVAAAWRGRYDRMRLNTSRLTSRLPGLRYPPGTGLFPTRDEFVAYLERYVDRHGIDLRLGVRVARIDRDDRGWRLQTSAGALRAEQAVVATGYERRPFIPPWPGRDRFTGRLLHAADYRDPAPFRGSDVLVVGSGSSGMEIAYDLAAGGAGPVRLSVRTPPSIVLRSMGGLPGDLPAMVLLRLPPRVGDSQVRVLQRLVLGDLAAHGLPVPTEGAFTRLRRLGVAPTVVDRQMVQAIRDRRIQVVSGLQALDATGATLADGTRVEPDVVVAATGYRRGLEGLVGHLGLLDERGTPGVVGGRGPAPGLRFVGFVPRPGQLHHMGVEARRAARSIARELRRRPAGRPQVDHKWPARATAEADGTP
jgi:putative flavoprotein involved in K+ transport